MRTSDLLNRVKRLEQRTGRLDCYVLMDDLKSYQFDFNGKKFIYSYQDAVDKKQKYSEIQKLLGYRDQDILITFQQEE